MTLEPGIHKFCLGPGMPPPSNDPGMDRCTSETGPGEWCSPLGEYGTVVKCMDYGARLTRFESWHQDLLAV